MPISSSMIRNNITPIGNKMQWLTVDLTTARTDFSLGVSGVGMATHVDYLGAAQFTLKIVFKDNDVITVSQSDIVRVLATHSVEFKDIKISNISQVGLIIKFLIIQHIPLGA